MYKTNWKKILEYVSEKSIGDLITRKELTKLIHIPNSIRSFKESSPDKSRILLTKFGVLNIHSRGVYIKTRNIKPDWSMFELEEIALHQPWKTWYLRLD